MTNESLFDKAHGLNTPLKDVVGRKIWKQALGMIVTNVTREKEISEDG